MDTIGKICRLCGHGKPLEEFYKSKLTKDGRLSYCRTCHNKKNIARKKALKLGQEKLRYRHFTIGPTKECRGCHQILEVNYENFGLRGYDYQGPRSYCRTCHSLKSRLRKPGRGPISIEEFYTLFNKQKGLCGICHLPPPDNNILLLQIDHDHKTGKIRGLLCPKCNHGLGQFKDNKNILLEAINYLNSYI